MTGSKDTKSQTGNRKTSLLSTESSRTGYSLKKLYSEYLCCCCCCCLLNSGKTLLTFCVRYKSCLSQIRYFSELRSFFVFFKCSYTFQTYFPYLLHQIHVEDMWNIYFRPLWVKKKKIYFTGLCYRNSQEHP